MVKKIKTQVVFVTWETGGKAADLPDRVKVPMKLKEDEEIKKYISKKFGHPVNRFVNVWITANCIKCEASMVSKVTEDLPYCDECKEKLEKKLKKFTSTGQRELI